MLLFSGYHAKKAKKAKKRKIKAAISFHNKPTNARNNADKLPENFVRSRDAAAPVNRDGGRVFVARPTSPGPMLIVWPFTTVVVGITEGPIV